MRFLLNHGMRLIWRVMLAWRVRSLSASIAWLRVCSTCEMPNGWSRAGIGMKNENGESSGWLNVTGQRSAPMGIRSAAGPRTARLPARAEAPVAAAGAVSMKVSSSLCSLSQITITITASVSSSSSWPSEPYRSLSRNDVPTTSSGIR